MRTLPPAAKSERAEGATSIAQRPLFARKETTSKLWVGRALQGDDKSAKLLGSVARMRAVPIHGENGTLQKPERRESEPCTEDLLGETAMKAHMLSPVAESPLAEVIARFCEG